MITYVEYSYGSNKGVTKQGDLISNPFKFGTTNVDYTGAKVVETATANTFKPAWGPVVGDVEYETATGWVAAEKAEDGSYTVVASTEAPARVRYIYDNVVIPQNDIPMVKAEIKSIALVAKARRIAVNRYAA